LASDVLEFRTGAIQALTMRKIVLQLFRGDYLVDRIFDFGDKSRSIFWHLGSNVGLN
jgi:hypothetical protein